MTVAGCMLEVIEERGQGISHPRFRCPSSPQSELGPNRVLVSEKGEGGWEVGKKETFE